MKKKLFTVLVAALMAASCSSPQTSTLEGQIEGLENRTILLSVKSAYPNDAVREDTLLVGEDGKFSYTLQDSCYREVMIFEQMSKEDIKSRKMPLMMSVIMLPGDKVTATGTKENYTMASKCFYDDKALVADMMKGIWEERKQMEKQIDERKRNGEDRSALDAEFMAYYKTWKMRKDSIEFEFIKANPNSNYSYHMAVLFNDSLKKEAMELLSDKVKQGPVKSYDEQIAQMMKDAAERRKAKAAAKAKLNPGMPAPDFTLDDLKGNPLSLSSLKGKYVVLDFWGSWCVWCLDGIPKMKDYYKKYSSKMEVLGIACRDTHDAWKKAVEKNALPWKNVINNDKGGTDVSSIYAVSGYPTKVIIDPKGNIVKIFLGESDEFYKFLDNLFKK